MRALCLSESWRQEKFSIEPGEFSVMSSGFHLYTD